jgi:TonB-dependent starch-binding outer membrane protein SusC
MRIRNYLFFLLCLAGIPATAQQETSKKISGIITDTHQSPLEGVSITLMHSKKVVTSNLMGQFSTVLSVPKDTLIITYVGYELKIVPVSFVSNNNLSIVLEPVQTKLNEVVINTGFQKIPKERLAGSYSFIDKNTLNKQTGSNILQRINGVATGVLFETNKGGTTNNIKIRGNSTINGPQDALIILDNFPYAGDIKNINPDDIESVTILKDASAASIWGARAGNGVIVLTSKKGKFNQPMRVEMNTDMIITEKPDLFYLPQISSADYIDVEQMLYKKGFYDFDIFLNPYTHAAFSPALDIFLNKAEGIISTADSTAQINHLKSIDTRSEFNKYVYKNAITQQYSMNINGGSENIAYLFGVAYDQNLDEIQDKSKKLNLHLENTFRPVKNLQVNISAYFTQSRMLSGMPAYNSLKVGARSVPYLQLADENGNPLPVSTSYRAGYVDTAGAGKLLDWKYYPLEDWKHNTATTTLNELIANVGLQYELTKGFQLNVQYQNQKQESVTDQLQDVQSFAARNAINMFSQVNNGVVKYIVPKGGILNSSVFTTNSYNLRTSVNFNHHWKRHSVFGIAGWEVQQNENRNTSSTLYGYNEDPLSSTTLDYLNSYPVYFGGTAYIPANSGMSHTLNRFVSFFTNLSYTIKDRYIFSFSGRRDAANIFGLETNAKWKPLWSGGFAWDLAKESFYKTKWLPGLKFRITYGHSGNVNLFNSASPVLNYYDPNPSYNYYNAGRILSLNNPDLRWEQVGTFNTGFDFFTKNNLLSGSIEYYVKRGTDLYGLSDYDYTAWGLSATLKKNVADMIGHGLELNLTSRNIRGKLNWTTNFIFNYYKDKVTKYYFPQGTIINAPTSGVTITPVIGKPVFSIISYPFAGLDSAGNPQGYLNGKVSTDYNKIIQAAPVTPNSLVYSGPSSPQFFGFVGNEFTYKSLSLTINIAYKLHYYFRRATINYDALFNQGIGNGDFSKRWQKPGDEKTTTVPSMIYPNNSQRDYFYGSSTATVSKADNIRIQFINLNYSLQRATSKRSFFQRMQLYLNAANLGIIWKAYKGNIDPDYPTSLKPPKSFTVGLRGNF